MATTDRDSGNAETISAAAVEVGQDSEEQSSVPQSRWPSLPWWWLGFALMGVSGAGMIAGLYGIPWAANHGHHGIMMAGTWLFLISGLIWLGASIALTWWVARDVGNLVGRLAKGIRRLAPNANPQMKEK